MTASEQEIRYALVDLEQERDVARDNHQPMLCRSLTVALTLARRGAAMRWRPIETAPKDGTAILGYWGPGMGLAVVTFEQDHDEWYAGFDAMLPPTHWMPLPEPPEAIE